MCGVVRKLQLLTQQCALIPNLSVSTLSDNATKCLVRGNLKKESSMVGLDVCVSAFVRKKAQASGGEINFILST